MKLCECNCGNPVTKEGNRFLKGHHNRGKRASEETKRLQSIAKIGKTHVCKPETRKKIRKTIQEGYDSGKYVAGMTGKHHSDPSKEKCKKSHNLARLDPTKYLNGCGKVRGYYYSTKNNKDIPYRSSYELEYMKQLESNPEVDWWKYESERVPYFLDGRLHITKPDFLVHYIDDHTELVEVKSYWCLDRPDVILKLEVMRKYAEDCIWIFRLITEKELFGVRN